MHFLFGNTRSFLLTGTSNLAKQTLFLVAGLLDVKKLVTFYLFEGLMFTQILRLSLLLTNGSYGAKETCYVFKVTYRQNMN